MATAERTLAARCKTLTSAHDRVWGRPCKIEISVLVAADWQSGYCTAYRDESEMERFASFSLGNIALHQKTVDGNSWHQHLRSKLSANGAHFLHHLPLLSKNKIVFLIFRGLFRGAAIDSKRSFMGEIWLRRIWKCDSMSAGWHLFSLGLLLWGIFIVEVTQLREWGNQGSRFSYYNKISITWQRLCEVLIICSNGVLTQCDCYHRHWG